MIQPSRSRLARGLMFHGVLLGTNVEINPQFASFERSKDLSHFALAFFAQHWAGAKRQTFLNSGANPCPCQHLARSGSNRRNITT